jgi:hypothetical protein
VPDGRAGDRALRAGWRLDERLEEDLLIPMGHRATRLRFNAYRMTTARDLRSQPATSEHVGNRAQQDLDVGP